MKKFAFKLPGSKEEGANSKSRDIQPIEQLGRINNQNITQNQTNE